MRVNLEGQVTSIARIIRSLPRCVCPTNFVELWLKLMLCDGKPHLSSQMYRRPTRRRNAALSSICTQAVYLRYSKGLTSSALATAERNMRSSGPHRCECSRETPRRPRIGSRTDTVSHLRHFPPLNASTLQHPGTQRVRDIGLPHAISCTVSND